MTYEGFESEDEYEAFASDMENDMRQACDDGKTTYYDTSNKTVPVLTDCTDTLRLVYDRGPNGYGVPVPGVRFRGTSKLLHALLAVQQDLRQIGWWDYIENFLTAGLYVDKPGAHGKGIAWDFDGVVVKGNPMLWSGKPWVDVLVYKSGCNFMSFRDEGTMSFHSLCPRIKTRFACLLSLRFGVVLTAGYNKAHEDHIHADLSLPVAWRSGSRTQVVCLQETLNAWFDAELVVDGIMGDKTKEAWWWHYGVDKPDPERWLDWLKMIAFNPPMDVK